MSRIANKPIAIPKGVEVAVAGETVNVKGKLGTMSRTFFNDIAITLEKDSVRVKAKEISFDIVDPAKLEKAKAKHEKELSPRIGLTWKLVHNMIEGVSQGYKKNLALEGVGYRANLEGDTLVLQVGFSKDVRMPVPKGLKVVVDKQVAISIEGVDRDLVGAFSAKIRKTRPVEPYKGKGIRYLGEHVRRKEGKAAGK